MTGLSEEKAAVRIHDRKTKQSAGGRPDRLPVPAGLPAKRATRRNRVALKVLPRRSSCCASAPRLTHYAVFIASLASESPQNGCFVLPVIAVRALTGGSAVSALLTWNKAQRAAMDGNWRAIGTGLRPNVRRGATDPLIAPPPRCRALGVPSLRDGTM